MFKKLAWITDILGLLFSGIVFATIIFTSVVEPIVFGIVGASLVCKFLGVRETLFIYGLVSVITNAVFMRYGYTYLTTFFKGCLEDEGKPLEKIETSMYYYSFSVQVLVLILALIVTHSFISNGSLFTIL